MKALLLLFSIYLLALGCLPCADDACAPTKLTVAAASHHSSDCHSEESCPPFCTCACCSIHISLGNTSIISIASLQGVVKSDFLSSLHQPLISRVGNSIWQPPRLG